MSNTKRIICLIIAVLMTAACFMPTAFAKADDDIARLYVCVKLKNSYVFGHAFLYVENISKNDIQVGLYNLEPGKGVSVGTFGFALADGYGVYYNVEAHCCNKFGETAIYSISDGINASELEKLSDYITSYKSWDPIIKNCLYFAFTAWNKVTDKYLFPAVAPLLGALLMDRYSCSDELIMTYPNALNVYKQRVIGPLKFMTVVSPESIEKHV